MHEINSNIYWTFWSNMLQFLLVVLPLFCKNDSQLIKLKKNIYGFISKVYKTRIPTSSCKIIFGEPMRKERKRRILKILKNCEKDITSIHKYKKCYWIPTWMIRIPFQLYISSRSRNLIKFEFTIKNFMLKIKYFIYIT